MPSNLKRIAIDFRMCRHAGIGRYIQETLRGVLKSKNFRFALIGYAADEKLARQLSQDAVIDYRAARSRIYSLAEQVELVNLASDADLFHSPHFNIPIFLKKPLIVTLHDLIYVQQEAYAKNLIRTIYVRRLLSEISKKASSVLTVSEYTKESLKKFLPGISSSKIFVTPEAAANFFSQTQDCDRLEAFKKDKKIEKPYCLFVGSLKAHKNIPTLIKAFNQCREAHKLDHELILVGRADKKDSLIQNLIAQSSFVRHVGEAPDDELVCWYNLASVFVLPSLMEGFGLPVLEAMASGAPAILSNQSSLPEVGGEAALYFDPLRADAIDALSELIYNVLSDKNLQQKMVEKGLQQAKKFTWQKTADQTLEAYARALHESRPLP